MNANVTRFDPRATHALTPQRNQKAVESLFGTIVLATGQTEACKNAAAFAKALAQRYGTRIVVAKALPSYPMDPIKAERVIRHSLISLCRWTRMRELEPYVTERIVVRDEPQASLARTLEIEPAKLVLMGSHGSKGFERLLLGSVAEELARESAVASLIVGPNCVQNFDNFARFRTVLFATDLSDTSFAPLELLRTLNASLGTKVFVVHAFQAYGAEATERYSQRMCAADLIKTNLTGIPLAGVAVEEGHPPVVIRRFAELFNADAIVLGLRRGGEYSRAATHLRSLTSKIIAVATCPVLTVATNRKQQ